MALFHEAGVLEDDAPVYSVSWEPLGRYLASATSECVRIRDTYSEYCVVAVLEFKLSATADVALAWDTTSRYLAASGFLFRLGAQIWDALGQVSIFDKCFYIDNGDVYKCSRSICFEKSGRYLAYGSGNSILLCDSPDTRLPNLHIVSLAHLYIEIIDALL